MKDQLLGKHVAAFHRGNLYEALKDAVAAGNDSDALFLGFCGKRRHRINLFISQEGEGLAFSHHGRRDQRFNLRLEIFFQIIALFFSDLPEIHQTHAISLHLFHQLGVNAVSSVIELFHFF